MHVDDFNEMNDGTVSAKGSECENMGYENIWI